MRNKVVNRYILFLFIVINLIHADISIMNMTFDLGILVFTIITIAAFGSCFWLDYVKRSDRKELRTQDWVIFGIILAIVFADIIRLISRAGVNTQETENHLLLCSLVLMYFILGKCDQVEEQTVLLFSISNFVMYGILIVNYITATGFQSIEEQITADGGIMAWLVLGVCVHMVAYCTDTVRQHKIWYGICALLGSFVLFMEKNMIAILIVEAVFFLIISEYQPVKGLIRNVMQLFFAFNFLLCNMSLVVGYVNIFKGLASYDLEVSVYLELVLAVIGLIFFTLWDKCNKEEIADDELMPGMLPFFKGLKIAAVIFLLALFAAATRGESTVLPEVMYKILSAFILGAAEQTGIFHTAGASYGLIGAAIIFVFLLILAAICFQKKEERPEPQRLLHIIVTIYLVQSILLKQTVMSVPFYAVFIIAYWNHYKKAATNIEEKEIEEESTDEANNSDTMLQ